MAKGASQEMVRGKNEGEDEMDDETDDEVEELIEGQKSRRRSYVDEVQSWPDL